MFVYCVFLCKRNSFFLSARTLNHISTEYVKGLRSSSYESTGRGSGKLQAQIRVSGLDKFRECGKMLCFYGFRPKACKLWSTLLTRVDQLKPAHPFPGDRLGMCINNNKSGWNQCFLTSSGGYACSFSYDNNNSCWCPSSPSSASDGGYTAEAWGDLLTHARPTAQRDWLKQRCGAQRHITIEKDKYGKIEY